MPVIHNDILLFSPFFDDSELLSVKSLITVMLRKVEGKLLIFGK